MWDREVNPCVHCVHVTCLHTRITIMISNSFHFIFYFSFLLGKKKHDVDSEIPKIERGKKKISIFNTIRTILQKWHMNLYIFSQPHIYTHMTELQGLFSSSVQDYITFYTNL